VNHVRIPDHVTWHDAGVDLIVFNQQDGTYHALDRTGSEIWRAIGREGPIDPIVALLRQRYPDAAGDIDADVRAFLADAARLGLLVVSPA
jgi:hypothetical protein